MAEHNEAFVDAQAEMLRRIGRYKHPPAMAALYHRMGRYCGGADGVDSVVYSLIKSGRLRVTNKIFHLPSIWDDFFSSLG